MQKFVIQGGYQVHGKIQVSGAKNHALKLFPAALLTDEPVILNNVPDIEDVRYTIEILKELGARVEKRGRHSYKVVCKDVSTSTLPTELAQKIRTSVLFIGPLLHRFGKVVLPHPGGDVIGKRPINFHIEGYKALGAHVKEYDDHYEFTIPSKKKKILKGARFVFEFQSVTSTENLILAAVRAQGKTELHYAACEPEIVALCDFLNSCGAKIRGAGTHSITIEGVEKLSGGECDVIPDRIETGTFAIMAAISHSELEINGCDPSHLEVVWQVLRKAGVKIVISERSVTIKPTKHFLPYSLKTHEYPGFPTDLQAPFTVLMTQAKGLSLIHETVWDGRLFYVDYLNRMGANITMCDPHRVLVNGPSRLYGRYVESPDIRAGIAMVIAGIVAEGETEIDNISQIDRGYENIENRLHKIGVRMKRI